jgi:hypothetical protein
MTPQRAREILNQFAHWSEAERSALLNEEEKGENMNPREDDEENWMCEDWEDCPDELIVLPLPPRPLTRLYNSALMALACGSLHRVLLVKDNYTFDAAHRLADVQAFEFEDEGYPKGGVGITFTATDNHHLVLDEVKFEGGMTGVFGGGVVYNERGLIAYLPIAGTLDGGTLTIRGEGP